MIDGVYPLGQEPGGVPDFSGPGCVQSRFLSCRAPKLDYDHPTEFWRTCFRSNHNGAFVVSALSHPVDLISGPDLTAIDPFARSLG